MLESIPSTIDAARVNLTAPIGPFARLAAEELKGVRPRLAESVVALSEEHGPVALVGWSLGGVLSREVARRHPEHVRRVITYGTPVVGGPSYTAVARRVAPSGLCRSRSAVLLVRHWKRVPWSITRLVLPSEARSVVPFQPSSA